MASDPMSNDEQQINARRRSGNAKRRAGNKDDVPGALVAGPDGDQVLPVSSKKRKTNDEMAVGTSSGAGLEESRPEEPLPASSGAQHHLQVLCGTMSKTDAQTRLMAGELATAKAQIATLESQVASKDKQLGEAESKMFALELGNTVRDHTIADMHRTVLHQDKVIKELSSSVYWAKFRTRLAEAAINTQQEDLIYNAQLDVIQAEEHSRAKISKAKREHYSEMRDVKREKERQVCDAKEKARLAKQVAENRADDVLNLPEANYDTRCHLYQIVEKLEAYPELQKDLDNIIDESKREEDAVVEKLDPKLKYCVVG